MVAGAQGIEISPRNMSVLELAANWGNASQGELVWRVGIPLAALNLAHDFRILRDYPGLDAVFEKVHKA